MSRQFEEVVDACEKRVYSYACHLLGDLAAAQDVTQEAFLRLWRNWSSIDLPRVEAWLTRVTRNLCYDRLRRRRTAAQYVAPTGDGDPDLFEAREPGPSDEAEATEFRGRLQAALARLTEPTRSALVLREVLGYPYADIAAALEVPLNSVRVYLHRGRKRLREELSKVYGDE